MANERENEGGSEARKSEFDREKDEFGQGKQGPAGQQSKQPQSGQQGSTGGQEGQQTQSGQQGQAQTGQQGQAGAGISERTGQQGQTGQQGSGFVGSQGEESGEYLQEDETKQAGFAEQGRGAPEEDLDIERTSNRDSDIEGSSDNR